MFPRLLLRFPSLAISRKSAASSGQPACSLLCFGAIGTQQSKDLIAVVKGQDTALLVGAWISGAYVDRLQVEEFGLIPLNVATWGPFVLLSVVKENSPHQEVGGNMVENEWLGSYSDTLKTNGVDSSSYVCSTYTILNVIGRYVIGWKM
ncbi:hypothetical protein GH714_034696 [Hevea brasiliensis]|uniref:Uncharacterized protein n=1 Tax=Hevea brasiliensis TaxID=3981 RepID=A0A6A6M418_HEVBR|nr:hypothetical protein GH714_034696 [Hevea brasiliensis]